MDAYRNLEWSKQNRRSEQRLLEYFSVDFSQYEEDIFNLHINEVDAVHQLNDTFRDDNAVALEYPVDPRTGMEVRQLDIDTTKGMRLYDSFPSGSMLTRAEHQHCLMVLNRKNMRLGFESAEDREALHKYYALKKKLGKEPLLYASFVKNYFNNHLVCRKSTIEKDLDDLVVAIWKGKAGNMLSEISSRTYILSTAVMWLNYKSHEQNVQFEPVSENVVEHGVVRNIFTENLLQCKTLKRNKRVLDNFFKDQHFSMPMNDAVQVDTVLKQDEDVRFVVDSGTLCHLLDCASNMDEQWMVPLRIETVEHRNVILIGKKFPATKMSTHARNVKAHKYLVRSFMSITKKEATHGLDKKTEERDAKCSKEIDYKVVEFDEYLRLIDAKSKTQYHPHRNSRLQLWKLQDGDDQYRFLIRSRMDCYESLRKMKFYINISIKLEYQAEFGAEQMTKSELIREWVRQFLRPNSRTLRLRINVVTHAILSHHYLELKDIEEALKRTYDIEPANLITNLWQTLKLLLNFPPGEHIMHHDIKNKETIMILSSDNMTSTVGSSIDLGELYSNVEYVQPALESYQWIPIDTSVITQLHREHTLLPCTFPHWNSVQRITSREKFKHKRPAAAPPPSVVKTKKKSKRRKQKDYEKKLQKKNQKVFVNEIQQSLNTFAPYEGPSRSNAFMTNATKKDPTDLVSFAKAREPFDYQAYMKQASAKKEDQ
ncbi:uncharacterized protein LOC135699461 [Ochlerotatus camptorhynchus]|uniref:uncharacterized protein LOC135699461 n=1 Tax=Ochlerotatus camptorhynchus TaxID=644619 RepID=UPI0031D0D32F